jgi:RimJ/RimL family protein N-acetyltransferase/mannose-6-phosphate isomerase-like protein (cupin superfamily)
MAGLPTLRTDRLVLRPFTPADAPEVQRLAGAAEVADTTLSIPHPYPDGAAEAWIATHGQSFERGLGLTFAVTEPPADTVLGAVGLMLDLPNRAAELGYWIGVPYWGRGHATEATRAVLAYGFRSLGLARIHARHFIRNAPSGRVMVKAGMRYEGCHRQAILKDGRFEDTATYSILREDFESPPGPQRPGICFATEQALAGLPGPAGERFTSLLRRGTLEVELYAPRGSDPQTPHRKDEVYVVVRGRGAFTVGGTRHKFEEGDLLFVPAGIEHRFESFTDDLAVWVLFYGPDGGELPSS